MQEKYYIVFDSEEGGVIIYDGEGLEDRLKETNQIKVVEEEFATAFEARLYIEYMQLD
jgi:hypothetical protein